MTPAMRAASDAAKARAGYAPVDTPCRPSRSAYMDDSLGTGAYLRAVERWTIYTVVMDVLGYPEIDVDTERELLDAIARHPSNYRSNA